MRAALLLAALLALHATASASDGAKTVHSSRDSLVLELSAQNVRTAPSKRGSEIVCANCAREVDGSLWLERSVELPSSALPKLSVRVLDEVSLKPAKGTRWTPRVDSAALRDGARAPRFAARIGTAARAGGAWRATVLVPVAPPGSREAPVRVATRARVKLVFDASPAAAAPPPPAATARATSASALPSGAERLVRLRVGDDDLSTFEEDGVYALSFEEFRAALASAGNAAAADGIPARRLALFAGLADTIPRVAVGAPTAGNLTQIPCEIRDHGGSGSSGDGLFGPGDTLLFFAHGASGFVQSRLESGAPVWRYVASLWGKTQDYVLALLESGEGLRLETLSAKGWGSPSGEVSSGHRYVRAEKDLLSTMIDEEGIADDSTGSDWYWLASERTGERSFSAADLSHPSLVPPEGFASSFRVALSFLPYGDFTVASNQRPVHDFRIEGATVEWLGWRGAEAEYDVSGVSTSEIPWSLKLSAKASALCRFNGMTVRWTAPYRYAKGAERVFNDRAPGLWKRTMAGVPSGSRVLRIVDGNAEVALGMSGSSWTDSTSRTDVSWWIDDPSARKRVREVKALLPPTDELTLADPATGRNAAGKKLSPGLLIVAPEAFLSQARDYARFRSSESASPVKCAVAKAEDLYLLYDGGRASPVALRDYFRRARELWPSLEAVMLVGDAHFDHLGASGIDPIVLPSYEYQTTITDDYFAALDEGESATSASYGLDVAVGRVPVRTADDFRNWFAKARAYDAAATVDLGDWRDRNLFAADDFRKGISYDAMGHSLFAETSALLADSLVPVLENRRFFLEDYPLDASGEKSAATTAFLREVNAGRLLTFYAGHGGVHQLADENLLDIARVNRLDNASRPGFFAAFSCSVGRFDRPRQRSFAEELLFGGTAGMVAIVAAARATYPARNESLAKGFLREFLSPKGATVGEALRRAKNAEFSVNVLATNNARKYALLGDPTAPNFPWKARVKLTSPLDTLRALDRLRLSGEVEGISDGEIFLQLEEQAKLRETAGTVADEDYVWSTLEPGRTLLGSRERVANGRFSAEFVVPRKLSFGDTNAVLRAYVWSNGKLVRGGTAFDGIAVSGTSSYADSLDDDEPPTIRARLCDQASGGYLAPAAKLTLPACLEFEVSDGTGVDQSVLPDEGVSFELVGKSPAYHPVFVEQTGKRVAFRVNLDEARPEGRVVARVRAQDIVGNADEKEWTLTLEAALGNGVFDVVTVPNPLRTKTTFHFKLGSGAPTDVSVRIYDVDGKLVRALRHVVSGRTTWDGRDEWGNRLANGLYYYQVIAKVRSADPMTGKSVSKTFTRLQKLVISR